MRFFKVDFGRFVEHQANYCDTDGNLLPFGEKVLEPNSNYPIEMPENLSKHETFPRVDFYNVNGKIYSGELTFYPASGIGKFTPIGTDSVLGELIDFDTI